MCVVGFMADSFAELFSEHLAFTGPLASNFLDFRAQLFSLLPLSLSIRHPALLGFLFISSQTKPGHGPGPFAAYGPGPCSSFSIVTNFN